MITLESTKAKDSFGDTINRAAYAKERIILTRRGKPVAALVPLEDIQLIEELENAEDAEDVDRVTADHQICEALFLRLFMDDVDWKHNSAIPV